MPTPGLDIDPPDLHRLNAACGWLELGNPPEAERELAQVAPRLHSHPAVLECRWRLYAATARWHDALATAASLAAALPDDPVGWIDSAYALHELRRTHEAWDLLLPVAERFPGVSVIPYNLACYACQLGQERQALEWLERAARVRNREAIKRLALRDADLRPLWDRLQEW